jgi:hypothetical protein
VLRRPHAGQRLPECWGLLLNSFGGPTRRANRRLAPADRQKVVDRGVAYRLIAILLPIRRNSRLPHLGEARVGEGGEAYEPVLRKPEKNAEGVQARLVCGGVAFAPLFAAQVTVICNFWAAVSTGGEMKW